MSEPSWLAPNPGREHSASRLAPPVDSASASRRWTPASVAVAASAAAAAADAARAAQALLLGSQHTPPKRKRSTPAASAEKQHVTANSVQLSEVESEVAGTCATRVSPPGQVQHTKEGAGTAPQSQAPQHDAHSEAAVQAPTSVQRSASTSPSPTAMRRYTTRGRAGTFQGKRPPKDPEKLKHFLKAKEVHEMKMMQLRKSKGVKVRLTKRPMPTSEDYHA